MGSLAVYFLKLIFTIFILTNLSHRRIISLWGVLTLL